MAFLDINNLKSIVTKKLSETKSKKNNLEINKENDPSLINKE